MELGELIREWRIWVLISALLISTVMLFPFNPLPYEQTGNGDYRLVTNINQGLDLKGGTRVLLGVQGNTSRSEVEQIGNILQQRVSAFGLTQASVRTVDLGDEGLRIQVEVATTNQTQLENLISQEGKFEARLPFRVRDSLDFELKEKSYSFNYTGGSVTVNGETYSPGDRFKLEEVQFRYVNNTESGANMQVVAYNGSDIEGVLTSRSRVSRSGSAYSFTFPIVLEQSAAERVRTIARNYEDTYTDPRTSEPYLGMIGGSGPAMLRLYVDGERQSSLRMGAVFRTRVVSQPSINGGGETEAAVRADMKELQAILQSGSLPSPVEIQSISTISSSLGSQFMSAAIVSILFSLVAVGALVFLRYRDPRLVLPIVITGASEVYILLGAFFSTIITLDLASIAGIIAAVGTGVDDQIIITDESGREIIRDWKKRLKRAFFVIFTSAASTIGAMMPVISPSISNLAIGAAGIGIIGYTLYSNRMRPHYVAIGGLAIAVSAFAFTLNPSGFALQSIQGFAITTILGVLVGITITRPAYAKFLEYLEN
ncbi:MAG: hypothetical protein ABEJ56_02050 [Candidatus Nanohaloarchaea archaeon]